MQAHAAVMPQPQGRWSIETLDVAEPGPREALVRVVASGICQTDVHARDGFFPIPTPAVYGHEGAGIVERIGSEVTSLAPGDHVIMANPSCGECADCRAGFETYCEHAPRLKQSGYRADGRSLAFSRGGEPVYGSFFQQSSFASLTLATERNTIRVPKDAPLDIVAAFPCGVNTGAGAVLNVLKPRQGDAYVAFGCGTVGFAGMLAALLCGCEPIIAVDLFDERLALARSQRVAHALQPHRRYARCRRCEPSAGGMAALLGKTRIALRPRDTGQASRFGSALGTGEPRTACTSSGA